MDYLKADKDIEWDDKGHVYIKQKKDQRQPHSGLDSQCHVLPEKSIKTHWLARAQLPFTRKESPKGACRKQRLVGIGIHYPSQQTKQTKVHVTTENPS